MSGFYEETLKMIEKRKEEFGEKVAKEAIRLLNSGAIDRNSHNRANLFGVAFENIADTFTTKNKEYKNLRRF